jgi:G3E family GTPase
LHTLKATPTNIITGSLGAGKTTFILNLLAQKPQHERWAVLVNEFGEVGIDGALLTAASRPDEHAPEDSESPAVFIREVPGGCMCCTSGLPMQIALNQLLAIAKPDRLLIEPTGLGHPTEVLQTLREPHYQDVLNVQTTFALIDARKLAQPRWRAHPTFQEQLQIADHIVSTKSEHYTNADWQALEDYLTELQLTHVTRSDTHSSPIPLAALSGSCPRAHSEQSCHEHNHEDSHDHSHDHTHDHSHEPEQQQAIDAPQTSPINMVFNEGQGFFAYGWICEPSIAIDYDELQMTLASIAVTRLKGVLRTTQGWFSINQNDTERDIASCEPSDDSRLEFIVDDGYQAQQIAESIQIMLNVHTQD